MNCVKEPIFISIMSSAFLIGMSQNQGQILSSYSTIMKLLARLPIHSKGHISWGCVVFV